MTNRVEPQIAPTAPSGSPRLIIVGDCDVVVWGLSSRERHIRAFERAGVRCIEDMRTTPTGDTGTIIVRADYLLPENLAAELAAAEGAILVVPGNERNERMLVAAHAGAGNAAEIIELVKRGVIAKDAQPPDRMRVLEPAELGSEYDSVLRKRATPLVLSLKDTPLREIESRTFAAVYKGATDFVTKWCWPVPARWVTRWAAERHITPNTVTTASLVLVILATILFAKGYFLLGIPVAWAMTFLDTVDGKLARVTLTSSRWGNIYDHGIDLIHPPFWWWAWFHAVQSTAAPGLFSVLQLALWVVIIGYVLGRLEEGVFSGMFKVKIHVWRPIDYFFRTITARRNPNLAILMIFALAGRPELGFLAIAIWTILSLIFHAVRICQAALIKLRGGEIRSWLSEPA